MAPGKHVPTFLPAPSLIDTLMPFDNVFFSLFFFLFLACHSHSYMVTLLLSQPVSPRVSVYKFHKDPKSDMQ